MSEPTVVDVSRRAVLGGAAVAVVGGLVGWLMARNSAAANGAPGTAAANGYQFQPSRSGKGRRLVALSAVPAGGGVVVQSARVVLTRDAAGSLHAFSAICTHQGCAVTSVREGTIRCPCHGSRFDAKTGAVVAGPAPAPLPAVTVEVDGGVVYAK
ncbi:MAG TPA: Rieske (2Fe-2S) protein [Gaiellales bacterium]|nr:Rieske (2Fe-2S) protein [Gaiellales bacterium]